MNVAAGFIVISMFLVSFLLQQASGTHPHTVPATNHRQVEVAAKATLCRDQDVVIVEGRELPLLTGIPIDRIRVVAFRGSTIAAIPFQIDERTRDNCLAYPYGPQPTKDEDPAFDDNDMILFMARDLGDPLPEEKWATLGTRAQEIEVSDPLHEGSKAWAYVVLKDTHPEVNPTTYVQYTYDSTRAIDNIDAQHYSIHYPWGEYYSETFFVPVSSGGEGTNFIDRFKARGTFKLLFSFVTVRITEDRMGSRVLAYIAGPIRVVRHVGYWVNIGLGIRSTSFDADISYYASFLYAPLTMRVPVRMDLLCNQAYADIGTDYNRNAYGLMFMNSNNPEGTLIDGRMSPQELALDLSLDEWRVVTGPQCTILRGRVPRCELTEQIDISLHYVDDYRQDDPPEKESGQIGHIFDRGDVTHLKPGSYSSNITLYMPPHYHPGDHEKVLRMERAPLHVVARPAALCVAHPGQ